MGSTTSVLLNKISQHNGNYKSRGDLDN